MSSQVTSTEPAEGLRARKRRHTRDALAAAALDLFEERGFAATTVDDIAERADVARRTFFRYFPTKEAVLFPDPSEYEEVILTTLDRLEPPYTMGRLLAAFSEGATAIDDDAVLRRRRAAVVAANHLDVLAAAFATFVEVRDTMVHHLAERAGVPDDDPVLELGVGLGLLAMAHAYVRWATAEVDGALVDELDRAIALLRGLITDEVAIGGPPPAIG